MSELGVRLFSGETYEVTLRLLWSYSTVVMELLYGCYGVTLWLLWSYSTVVMELLYGCLFKDMLVHIYR